tara:strand:- start:3231 stop:3485 length:255 start_codon:yes stop_codon:yes gene_type:complete
MKNTNLPGGAGRPHVLGKPPTLDEAEDDAAWDRHERSGSFYPDDKEEAWQREYELAEQAYDIHTIEPDHIHNHIRTAIKLNNLA